MNNVIESFLVRLGYTVDKGSEREFTKSLSESVKKVALFAGTVKALSAGIYAGVSKIAEEQARLADVAARVGTSSKEIETLGYVAEQTGSDMGKVISSLEAIAKKNPTIKDTGQYLMELGERMKGMTQVQKLNFMATMGIDPSLLRMLTEDVSGLRSAYLQMYETAGIGPKEAAENARSYTQTVNALKSTFLLLIKTVSLKVMKPLRENFENVRKNLMINFSKIVAFIESVIKVILRISEGINIAMSRIIAITEAIVKWWDGLSDAAKNFIKILGLVAAAWKILNMGFLASPLGILITLFIALALAVDDLMTYLRGGKSVFDWGPFVKQVKALYEYFKPLINLVKDLGSVIATALSGTAGPALEGFKAILKSVLNLIEKIGAFFKAVFSGDLSAILEAGKQLFLAYHNFVQTKIEAIKNIIKAFFANLWVGVKERFPNFAKWAEDVKDSIIGAFQKVKDFVLMVLDKIGGAADKVGKGIKAVASFFGFGGDDEAKEDESEPGKPNTPAKAAAVSADAKPQRADGKTEPERAKTAPQSDAGRRFVQNAMGQAKAIQTAKLGAPSGDTTNIKNNSTSNVNTDDHRQNVNNTNVQQNISVTIHGDGDAKAVEKAAARGAQTGADLVIRNTQVVAR